MAIECKWTADNFDATNLKAFGRQHLQGENVVLAADVKVAFQRNYGTLKVRFAALKAFVSHLAEDCGSIDARRSRTRFDVSLV